MSAPDEHRDRDRDENRNEDRGQDEDEAEYLHRHIPRDSAGNPIFLILPASDRTWYERKMRGCERGWRATGDPLAISEAVTLTFLHRQPLPAWLDEAVWALANARRHGGHSKREREAFIRSQRYQAVRWAQRDGMNLEKAYVEASRILADTKAGGTPEVMADAFQAVRRDLKEGRGGLYFTRQRQNRKPPQPG
jgi:hypothetical protein